MEKFISCFILLIAAALLVPGCFAEEMPMTQDANVTEVIETTEETAVSNTTEMIDGVNATEVLPIAEETAFNTTYTADVNVTNLTMAVDETILISLSENPTTGYMWNVTNSSGLEIVNDTYTMDAAKEGMVGVGGVHEWIVKAVETGNQTFSAVMMRSFEPVTGDEETYTFTAIVE